MARASASVVGSGTVGPEPIADGSSSGTSEIAMVTSLAGNAVRASRPPLMRERCLRTVLISPMFAPERKQRARHRLLVGEGDAGRRRDPVGGGAARHQHQHQVVFVRAVGEFDRAQRGFQARPVRHRMAGFDHGHYSQRPSIAVARHRNSTEPLGAELEPVEVVGFGHLGHGACRFAGGEQNEPSFRWRRQQWRQAGRRMRSGYRSAE